MGVFIPASSKLACFLGGHSEKVRHRSCIARGPEEPRVFLNYADVLGFLALLAGRGVELNALTLFEALVAVALDVGEMDKHVITLLARDETESLFCIEKLHCTLCHEYSILKATDQPIWLARYEKAYSPTWRAEHRHLKWRRPCHCSCAIRRVVGIHKGWGIIRTHGQSPADGPDKKD
jgi:hypothetical protein